MVMKKLWAPWRIQYILHVDSEKEGCIFCVKPKENKDEKNLILFRGEKTFVMMNLFPYNTGHLMVAPFRHTGGFVELDEEEGKEIFKLTQLSLKILKEVMEPDGFNLGTNIGRVAGAGYEDHVHLHIVPRWSGDTNFMPIIADVKIIPEGLKETYKKLKPLFDKYGEELKEG